MPWRRRNRSPDRPVDIVLPGAATAPRRRLLVCDDNSSVTDLLRLMFSQEDWEIAVVTNGPDCLAALAGSRPDVLLLDQRLEGPLTGIETAESARRRGFDMPILLFSAYLDDEARASAERLRLLAVSKVDFPAIVRHVNEAYRLTAQSSQV